MSSRNPARTLRKSSETAYTAKAPRRGESPTMYKHGAPPSQEVIFHYANINQAPQFASNLNKT